MYKKARCTCKIVVLLTLTYCFFDVLVAAVTGSLYVSRKLPTYPSPKSTLTLNSQLGQNVGLGEG